MESARGVGLPPAYEDADIDALCQLIGMYDLIIRKTNYNKSLYNNSAHARPPDIHQRPYPAFTVRDSVSIHALLSMSTHIDLIYLCFSFLSNFFLHRRPILFCDFHGAQIPMIR